MTEEISWLVSWMLRLQVILGILVFLFGVFTALWPVHSIRLYQWIMKQFNWIVEPADYEREVRTTRYLGAALIVLGFGLTMVPFFQGF